MNKMAQAYNTKKVASYYNNKPHLKCILTKKKQKKTETTTDH